MADYAFHEVASLFPLMGEDDLDTLGQDIKHHGLQIPIELFEGKILDGRNRQTACLMAGIEPDYIEVDPDDPVEYVWSLNRERRHLDQSQLAMVGARRKTIYEQRAKERQAKGRKAGGKKRQGDDSLVENLPPSSKARDQAGAAVGVSGRSVDHASKVIKSGSAKLQKAVASKTVAVSTAAKLAELPKAQQDKALAGGKEAIKDAVMPEWAQGPTPQEQAKNDPGVRWSASLHKLYVFMTSTRDHGGIAKLARKWREKTKAEYVVELRRIRCELQKWINLLEGKS